MFTLQYLQANAQSYHISPCLSTIYLQNENIINVNFEKKDVIFTFIVMINVNAIIQPLASLDP